MDNKLKRGYSRACIILFSIGIIGIWLPVFLYLDAPSAKSSVLIGTACMLLALGIKFLLLKCQACGYRGLIPQWDKNDSYCCPKCGKKVHWDK